MPTWLRLLLDDNVSLLDDTKPRQLPSDSVQTNRRPVVVDPVSVIDQVFDELALEDEQMKTVALLEDDDSFSLEF